MSPMGVGGGGGSGRMGTAPSVMVGGRAGVEDVKGGKVRRAGGSRGEFIRERDGRKSPDGLWADTEGMSGGAERTRRQSGGENPVPRGEDVVEIGGKTINVPLPITGAETVRNAGAGGEGTEGLGGGAGGGGGGGFISLWFRCSATYARGYKTRDGSAYFARCPKCGKTISLPIGPGGTSQRSFQVSCQ